jgi:hypothetical protein
MAARDDKQQEEAPKAAREAAKAVEVSEDEETYPVEWLLEAAAYIGYKPADIAGALSAQSKKNLTIEETRAIVKAWLGAPVKTEA